MKKPSLLRLAVLLCLFTSPFLTRAQVVDSTTALFNIDTVAKNLGYPWEITYGPDDSLWITEARGYRVVRITPNRTQAAKNVPPQQLLKIPLGGSLVNFSRSQESIGRWPQGGMQGLAIHPDFNNGKPWVYLSYVFRVVNCPNNPSSACYYRAKIVRCEYFAANDPSNPSLRIPKQDSLVILDTVISNLPGSNDHNSGRLTIKPVMEGGNYKLYYTIGDMGAGQFNNATRTNYAQTRDTVEGKILRLNTEPDTDGTPGSPIHDFDRWREWIPNDNPYTHATVGGGTMHTPIYSYGHRNAQGIVWGNVNGTWHLYSSEHGDKSDDEVNEIFSGKNYGWPRVAGMCEDNYTTADDGAPNFYSNNNTLAGQTITNENASFCNVGANNHQRPVFSTFNWNAGQIEGIDNGNIFTWPTIAPSSIDFYGGGQIPGWRNSLLVTSLKYGMYRLKLKTAGNYVDSTSSTNTVDTFPLLHSWRVRDVAISPYNGGARIWVVMDSTGSTSGPTGGFGGGSSSTKDGGKVLMLTYKNMSTLPVNDNPRATPPVVNDLVYIFPNPVRDQLNIHGRKELRKPLLVQIYDVNGRVLKEEKSFRNDFSVDVSSLTPGVYFLKLYNGYDLEVQIEKFIKE